MHKEEETFGGKNIWVERVVLDSCWQGHDDSWFLFCFLDKNRRVENFKGENIPFRGLGGRCVSDCGCERWVWREQPHWASLRQRHGDAGPPGFQSKFVLFRASFAALLVSDFLFSLRRCRSVNEELLCSEYFNLYLVWINPPYTIEVWPCAGLSFPVVAFGYRDFWPRGTLCPWLDIRITPSNCTVVFIF